MITTAMRDTLQTYIADALPDRAHSAVRELVGISAGWESDVYAFDSESGPTAARRREPLILRIYPGNDAQDKSWHEFGGMQALHAAGYPVPRVLTLERDASPFGRPFVIMERAAGKPMWSSLFRSPEPQQSQLLTLFCDLLVRLHQLDWQPLIDDPAAVERAGPYTFVDGWLAFVHEALAQFNMADADALLHWLEARRDRVPCGRPAPVHWDFHPENVLWAGDDTATVIDWTQIQVSDCAST